MEVITCADSALLKPGEQAIAGCGQEKSGTTAVSLSIIHADTAQVLSWQREKRIYNRVAAKDLLNELARWYDLELVNMDCVPLRYFSGIVCYNTPVSDLLKSIQRGGVNFRREGRKIIFCAS